MLNSLYIFSAILEPIPSTFFKSIKLDTPDKAKYIHRGISRRGFNRSFQLADFMEVIRANMQNGLLEISLKREIPQALQPKTIKILEENKIINKAA